MPSAQTTRVAQRPDGELIDLCRECDILHQRFQATFQQELELGIKGALKEQRQLITKLQKDVLDQVCALPAITLEGSRRRNHVNVLGSLQGLYWAGRMVDASRRNVIGDALPGDQQAGAMSAQLQALISIPPVPGEAGSTAWKPGHGRDPDCRVPQLTPADRRRPGRLPNRASHLIGLLRGETSTNDTGEVNDAFSGDPEPALGKTTWLVLRFSAWFSFAVYSYILFHRLGILAQS